MSTPTLARAERPLSSTAGTAAERIADWPARAGLALLGANIVFGLVGGALMAATWQSSDFVQSLGDKLFLFTTGLYLLALVLGVPSLLIATGFLVRGQWAAGMKRLLPFVGPLAILFGFSLLSHSLIPCSFDTELPLPVWPANNLTPWLCEEGGIRSQFHIVHHALAGALPFALLYWLALRRWYTAITRFR